MLFKIKSLLRGFKTIFLYIIRAAFFLVLFIGSFRRFYMATFIRDIRFIFTLKKYFQVNFCCYVTKIKLLNMSFLFWVF